MRRVAIALLITFLAAACIRPAGEQSGTPPPGSDIGSLVRAIDGDSMDVLIDGTVREVRLIGINAPESDECFGAESRDTLIATIRGRDMILTPGPDDADRYGRLLRYATVEGDGVNERMLATGSAITLQTNHPLADEYVDLGAAASKKRLGLWAADACGPPQPADIAITDVSSDPPGPDDERLNDEYVTITNNGTEPVDLHGWVLRDESSQNRYRYRSIIGPGGSVTVRTGCGEDRIDTVFWCADLAVWSNGGDTAIIQDRSGNVVDRWSYTVRR